MVLQPVLLLLAVLWVFVNEARRGAELRTPWHGQARVVELRSSRHGVGTRTGHGIGGLPR